MVDLVLDGVRRGILRGELRPGEALSISDLSQKFGISHIPVREALRRLDGDGLIQLRPSKSAIIAPIDAADLRQIYRLRISIEGDLVARAAKRYTAAQLAKLEALLDQLAPVGGDQEPLGNRHAEFHRVLLEPVASDWDWRVLDPLWRASGRYLMLLFEHLRAEQGGESLRESHLPLVDAATRRSPRDLRRALTDHLEAGVTLISAALGEATPDG